MQFGHCQVVVLISGNGSNLQALIDASCDDDGGGGDGGDSANYEIVAVISNRADAYGLQRAEKANIPAQLIDHRDYASRVEFDLALINSIDKFQPALIVLAGFMRILSREFVQHYHGRVLNIHPSLLPKYTGTNTHQRVLDAKENEHGVSVHFVTEELDGGPVIAQEKIAILTDDNAKDLAARVAKKEHILYPRVVAWFAANRLRMIDNHAYFDQQLLPEQGLDGKPVASSTADTKHLYHD